jgi:HK97 gp10 family phage protein
MVQLAPKRTGFLSEHFNIRIKFQKGALACTAFIGPKGKIDYPEFLSGAYRVVRNAKGAAKYAGRIAVATVARFLEFGTSKMAKKPFMTQAYETRKEKALDAVAQSLKETLGL